MARKSINELFNDMIREKVNELADAGATVNEIVDYIGGPDWGVTKAVVEEILFEDFQRNMNTLGKESTR
jgi:hypothetical protein